MIDGLIKVFVSLSESWLYCLKLFNRIFPSFLLLQFTLANLCILSLYTETAHLTSLCVYKLWTLHLVMNPVWLRHHQIDRCSQQGRIGLLIHTRSCLIDLQMMIQVLQQCLKLYLILTTIKLSPLLARLWLLSQLNLVQLQKRDNYFLVFNYRSVVHPSATTWNGLIDFIPSCTGAGATLEESCCPLIVACNPCQRKLIVRDGSWHLTLGSACGEEVIQNEMVRVGTILNSGRVGIS